MSEQEILIEIRRLEKRREQALFQRKITTQLSTVIDYDMELQRIANKVELLNYKLVKVRGEGKKSYAVTGYEHGSIIYADTEEEALTGFKKKYNGEEVLSIRDMNKPLTDSNILSWRDEAPHLIRITNRKNNL